MFSCSHVQEANISKNQKKLGLHIMHQKMYLKALVLFLLAAWITTAYPQQPQNLSEMKTNSDKSTMLFPLTGNVYPLGYYSVSIHIGKKRYVLDIDTGSDLTWLNCDCVEEQALKNNPRSNFQSGYVTCQDTDCTALGDLRIFEGSCTGKEPGHEHPCGFKVYYADGFSTSGILVSNSVHLQLRNGNWVIPRLTFGCADTYVPQQGKDGMLGLSNGKSGFLSQLHNMGLIENVVGHCLRSGEGGGGGGGYLFFGNIPFLGIVWKQLDISDEHYNLGRANIWLNDQETDIRNRHIIFDSGSTYTYLDSDAYDALLDLITKNLRKSPLTEEPDDTALVKCWKGDTRFNAVSEVAQYFKSFALIFPHGENVKFQIPQKSYLIISGLGNVCLGILDGGHAGLEEKIVIGDISMHDKLVIYDNENGKVGWADANCNLKKS